MIAEHTIQHPEIGLVLDSQCGAQSEGCAYDTPDRSAEAAPEWLRPILVAIAADAEAGHVPIASAVLASDGWWWWVN